jgi:hypothetical protein
LVILPLITATIPLSLSISAARIGHLAARGRDRAKLHRWRAAAGRKSTPGPPMTLGNAATARVRLIERLHARVR